jgi:hypothetical protein
MVYCDIYMKRINTLCAKYTVIFNAKYGSIYKYISHIYIYIYVCVCVCVCIYIYTYVCVHIYIIYYIYRYASLNDGDTS